MNIGIDIDGVLTDFVAVAIYQMKRKNGTWRKGQASVSHKHCKSINLWECGFDITKKEYDEWFKQLPPSFWADLPMLCTEEDIENLNKVSRYHSVYAITDTPNCDAIHQRNLWLFNNGVEDVSVIPTSDKASVILALDIDAMIDDSPYQLSRISGTGCKLYHPIYPYTMKCAGDGVTSITDYLTRLGVI